MSFGFSVGDFISGAALACSLIRALSSTSGASLEYQNLIDELEIVRLTCVQIENLRDSHQLSLSLLNALTHIVRDCNRKMEECELLICRYKECLSPQGSGSSFKDSWAKIGWSLFKVTEVKDIRQTLQLKMSCISTLLSASGCQQEIVRGVPVDLETLSNGKIKDDWSHYNIFCQITPPPRDEQRRDPTYRVQEDPESFFRLGQVCAIIDTAGYDAALRNIGGSWKHRPDRGNPFAGPVSVRRLIVVKTGSKSCLCLGVHNYHGNGCVEERRQDLHTIIYATKTPPEPLTVPMKDLETNQIRYLDERRMLNRPIRMEVNHPSVILQYAARISYTRIHQLDYRMRVQSVGQVVLESIQDLSDQFQEAVCLLREEANSDTSGMALEALELEPEEIDGVAKLKQPSSYPSYIWTCCQCEKEIETILSDCCTMQSCRHAKCDACSVSKATHRGLGIDIDIDRITPPSTPKINGLNIRLSKDLDSG